MAVTNKIEYYMGIISYVEDDPLGLLKDSEGNKLDKTLQVIVCDIPGVIDNIRAFPKRNCTDDPKVGDKILLSCLDPIFHSYWLYEKLKEDDFVGFRTQGKLIDITPDNITIGIYNPNNKYPDCYHPTPDASITIDNNGNITIDTDAKVTINSTVFEINSENCNINSNKIKIEGDGTGILEVANKGTVIPNEAGGPFNCIRTCPYVGMPHQGNIIAGL